MNTLIILFIAMLPIYIICLYIYKNDKFKEPKRMLLTLFTLGMLSSIPVAIIELNIDTLFAEPENMNLFTLFIYTAICIASVEELFKWLITYHVTYKSKEFDELYDGIVYAVFVALGFACIENILYVIDTGIKTGILRALIAVPAHAANAIILGTYLGLAKLSDISNNSKLKHRYLILSILIPIIIHTIYDYLLLVRILPLMVIFDIFIVFLFISSLTKIKNISSQKKKIF